MKDIDHIMNVANKTLEGYEDVEQQLNDSEIFRDKRKFAEASKKYSFLSNIKVVKDEIDVLLSAIKELEEIIENEKDEEIVGIAFEEMDQKKTFLKLKISEIKNALCADSKKDPSAPVLMEIKAGTGGEEAALFCRDMHRMYGLFCDQNNLEFETLDFTLGTSFGYRDVIIKISGKDTYRLFRYEGGGHRVQRVPRTESQGRIHTSLITIAVLIYSDNDDVVINNKDLIIETFRSGGAGGQHVNTTDSAVRITHIPTKIVVKCEDQRSQHSNKERALKILKAKIIEEEENRKKEEKNKSKLEQSGSGDRGERIRTYNFPQNRLTDHRINKSWYNLNMIMEGDILSMLESVKNPVED